ncbi:hypothetical protein PsYK624_123710 [Phanerochaete sordida]|uniref:Uncharacterized protein n=1 Tax=Phanerochaete sordida TaxID=48140 RepID=A0A9P3LIH8_9APHY|nr:hypothetical protein PsYK624_123710 [Phanerochaete sordida]
MKDSPTSIRDLRRRIAVTIPLGTALWEPFNVVVMYPDFADQRGSALAAAPRRPRRHGRHEPRHHRGALTFHNSWFRRVTRKLEDLEESRRRPSMVVGCHKIPHASRRSRTPKVVAVLARVGDGQRTSTCRRGSGRTGRASLSTRRCRSRTKAVERTPRWESQRRGRSSSCARMATSVRWRRLTRRRSSSGTCAVDDLS